MDRYLDGEDIDQATLIADLETAVARGSFHPVIPVCAATGIGLDELLDGIARAFPSPLEHPVPEVTAIDGIPQPRWPPTRTGHWSPRWCAPPSTPTSAACRWSGSSPARCGPERPVHVSGHGMADRGHEDHDADERVAHIYSPLGAACARSRTASPATSAR